MSSLPIIEATGHIAYFFYRTHVNVFIVCITAKPLYLLAVAAAVPTLPLLELLLLFLYTSKF